MDQKSILVVLVALVMGWFALGMVYNLRKGERVLKWMRAGLARIGERSTFRWLGSSVAEMVIAKPKKPFRRVELMVVMAPRDAIWMWVITRLQRRRDFILLRMQLNASPAIDFDLADPASWTGKTAIQKAAGRGWESQPRNGLQLWAPRGYAGVAGDRLAALEGLLQSFSPRYDLVSLRKENPHLELHLPFPDQKSRDAGDWFGALQEIARSAARED